MQGAWDWGGRELVAVSQWSRQEWALSPRHQIEALAALLAGRGVCTPLRLACKHGTFSLAWLSSQEVREEGVEGSRRQGGQPEQARSTVSGVWGS